MKTLLSKLETYLDWLETPNKMFGGQPVCPFLASDRKNNKLKIEVFDPSEIQIETCQNCGSSYEINWRVIQGDS